MVPNIEVLSRMKVRTPILLEKIIFVKWPEDQLEKN